MIIDRNECQGVPVHSLAMDVRRRAGSIEVTGIRMIGPGGPAGGRNSEERFQETHDIL